MRGLLKIYWFWLFFALMSGHVYAEGNAKERSDAKPQKVVAVAEVKVTVPAAKLVYTPDSVRDVVTSSLVEAGKVKVIDWSRLSEVLFRRNLGWSDVVEKKEERQAVREILLNDYFLVGSVSAYSEHWDYQTGAFSKSKTQVVRVQLELFIKDALTNEIKAAGRGEAERRKEVSQTLGFGAAGGSDATLALSALNEATNVAVNKMLGQLNPAWLKETVRTKQAKEQDSGEVWDVE